MRCPDAALVQARGQEEESGVHLGMRCTKGEAEDALAMQTNVMANNVTGWAATKMLWRT